jgi:phospholipase/carboxylesterase
MHPLIPWGPAPQPGLAGKRALITAGRRDPIAPAVQTDALALYLERQGVETALHWHEGGHGVDPSEIEAIRAFLA